MENNVQKIRITRGKYQKIKKIFHKAKMYDFDRRTKN